MVSDPENYTVILRFLGTTIDTSSIYKTYSSIALQLHFLVTILQKKLNQKILESHYAKHNLSNYEEYCTLNDIDSQIKFIFKQFEQISKLDPKRKVLILLDSLDQLTPSDYKNVSIWFFSSLPSNVKLIVSTIPDHGDLLNVIKTRIKFEIDSKTVPDSQILSIQTMSTELSVEILKQWLLAKNKKLIDDQWKSIKIMFDRSHLLPLYLQLIYDVVLHWRSFDSIDDKFISCRKTDDVIEYIFKRMEDLHGEVMFSHAIFYMTACKNGISEQELEDILSLDDEVLRSVFQYHVPPIRRIPVIFWVRIHNELYDYIDEREANEVKVIQWHHRRFVEVAMRMYVEPLSKTNASIFENMIDFYNERWKNEPKPLVVNDHLKKKLKRESILAGSYVSSQPIEYVNDKGEIHFNKRKLTELPNCLANISGNISIEKACKLIFYNYEFLHAKFSCDSLNDILDDLKRIMESYTSWNVSKKLNNYFDALVIMKNVLLLCGDQCKNYPDSLAFQITSRLLYNYNQSEIIANFILECDRLSLKHCAIVSPYYQLRGIGGSLIAAFNKHNAPITHVLPIAPYFITLSANKIHICKLVKKDELKSLFDINLPSMNEHEMYKKIKAIKLEELESREEDETPENFPLDFCLISTVSVIIVAPNKEVKFRYTSKTKILDAFCISQKQLVIIEKDKSAIKLFSNYIFSPSKFINFEVSDSYNIVDICNRNLIETSLSLITFYLILADSSIKKVTLMSSKKNYDSLKMVEDDINIFNQSSFKQSRDLNSSFSIVEKFKIRIEDNILPKFSKLASIVKKDCGDYTTIVSNKATKDTDSYLSTTDGHFMVANELENGKETKLLIFKKALTEPLRSIHTSHACKQSLFILLAKTHLYVVHKNSENTDDYCFVKIDGNFDYAFVWSNNSVLVVKNNLIVEVYRIRCLKHTHRIKTVLSFYAHADTVVHVLRIGKRQMLIG